MPVRKNSQFVFFLRILALLLIFLAIQSFTPHASAQTTGYVTSANQTWQPNLPASLTSTRIYPGVAEFPFDGDLLPSGSACLSGDFNGDGKLDIACLLEDDRYDSTQILSKTVVPSAIIDLQNTGVASSGFATSTAYGTITQSDTMSSGSAPGCATGDFDGDGRADLACFTFTDVQDYNCSMVSGVCHTVSTGYNYPTAWFSQPNAPLSLVVQNSALTMPGYPASGLAYDKGASNTFNTFIYRAFGNFCTVGQFMAGPGQQILCNVPTGGAIGNHGMESTYSIWKYTGSYSGGTENITESQYAWLNGPTGPSGTNKSFGEACLTGDFNGDGLTDIACQDGAGGWNVGLSTGRGFAVSDWKTGDTANIYSGVFSYTSGAYAYIVSQQCAVADFNGDGKADIICYVPNSGNTFHAYLSNGSGFQPMQTWTFNETPPIYGDNIANPQFSNPKAFDQQCQVADINGDGKDDILCYSNNSSLPGDWVYGLSTGVGFSVGHLESIVPPATTYVGTALGVGSNEIRQVPFVGLCTIGNFIGNGLPDILCNNTGLNQTNNSSGDIVDPVVPYSVGVLSRQ